MKKRLAIVAIAVAFASSLPSNAFGLTIDSPLTMNSDGVLGTVRPGVPFGSNVVDDYTNYLLDMSLNTSRSYDRQTYYRNGDADPGTGEVSSTDFLTGTGTFIEAGWEYLAAKYDGPNGGLVVIYLGGESATIPMTSYNLWTNKAGAGYGLSGWVAFNSVCVTNCDDLAVPDAGSTVALFGSALLAFGLLRRKLSRN